MILGQDGHAPALADRYLALVGSELAGKEIEEGRLAGPVRPDDAVAVAGSKFEVDVLEEHAFAEGEREIGYANHGTASFAWKRRGVQGARRSTRFLEHEGGGGPIIPP